MWRERWHSTCNFFSSKIKNYICYILLYTLEFKHTVEQGSLIRIWDFVAIVQKLIQKGLNFALHWIISNTNVCCKYLKSEFSLAYQNHKIGMSQIRRPNLFPHASTLRVFFSLTKSEKKSQICRPNLFRCASIFRV